MSTIKSSAEDLTLNADGSNNDIIFQSNGSNVATLDQAGLLTATTFAGSGASLTALPAAQLTGTLPAISATNLTNVPAANITGTLPAIDGSSLTGISGGITECDQWRLSTDRGTSAGAAVITANWERMSGDGFGLLGTGMSESSGVFTFPSTGFWLVTLNLQANQITGAARYVFVYMQISTDGGSSWDEASQFAMNIPNIDTTEYSSGSCTSLFDVTSTSNFKVRVSLTPSVYVVVDGDGNNFTTGFTFRKYGDT